MTLTYHTKHTSFALIVSSPSYTKVRSIQRIDLIYTVSGEDRIVENHEVRRYLTEITNQTTVPNIFINGSHLGGSSDLLDANNSGRLQKMLDTKNIKWIDPASVKPIPVGWSDIDGKDE
jgi:glutaredoxin-related protein